MHYCQLLLEDKKDSRALGLAIKAIDTWESVYSHPDLIKLTHKLEPIIFKNIDADSGLILNQMRIIGSNNHGGAQKIFKSSQDEAFRFIFNKIREARAEESFSKYEANDNEQLIYMGNIFLVRLSQDKNEFHEADKYVLELIKAIPKMNMSKEMAFGNKWITKAMQFQNALGLNQLKRTKELSDDLNDNFMQMLEFSSTYKNLKGPAISMMVRNLEYLISIGDKEMVRRNTSLMLNRLDSNSNDLNIVKSRIAVLKALNKITNPPSPIIEAEISTLEEKIGLPTHKKIFDFVVDTLIKYRKQSEHLEKNKMIKIAITQSKTLCSSFDVSASLENYLLGCRFTALLETLLKKETIESLNNEKNQRLKKEYKSNLKEEEERVSDYEEMILGYQDSIKTYQDSIKIYQENKSYDQIKYGKILKLDKEGNSYEISKETKIKEFKETIKKSKETIKRHIETKERILDSSELTYYQGVKFFDSVATLLERGNSYSFPNNIELMNNYQHIAGILNNIGTNKQLASFYIKKYINLFQDIRSKIDVVSNADQLLFTKKYKVFLKEAISIFYSVNDLEAAKVTFKIIKENEYLDFIQRSKVSDDFLSRLKFLEHEESYHKIIKKYDNSFSKLDMDVKNLQNKYPFEPELFLKLKQKLQQQIKNFNQDRLTFLNQDFKSLVLIRKNQDNKLNQIKKKALSGDLKNNEAHLYISLTENKIKSYLFTNTYNEEFNQDIDGKDFSSLVNDIALSVQKNKKIDINRIKRLSTLLIRKPFDKIHEMGIKNVKLFLADNILLNVPIPILIHNSNALLADYSFEFSTLQKSNLKEPIKNKNFDMYGATKGSGKFKDLPGVHNEIKSLSAADLGDKLKNKSIYLDKAFTKDSLIKSFTKNNDYIHIATHFNVSGNTDELTQLLLGNKDIISLKELRDSLPIFSNQLIVLSACESANTLDLDNDNIYDGLAGVFQEKGANNVLATLWEISDDATSSFMLIFYSLLASNDITPSTALAFTQRIFNDSSFDNIPSNIDTLDFVKSKKLLQSISKFSHPYFWAGFILYSSQ